MAPIKGQRRFAFGCNSLLLCVPSIKTKLKIAFTLTIMDPLCGTLIGAGTIGLSFAASHLTQARNCEVIIYDTRPDIKDYIYQKLPGV
jgi:hypothetical protein